MKYEKVSIDAFSIAGISVRTANQNGRASLDMKKIWEDFRLNLKNIVDDINNRLSDDIYCVYTDYESDKDGEYTVIVGYKVSNTNDITGEYTFKEIPAANYYKIMAEGKIPDCTKQAWQSIWQSDINRSYLADFEVYGKEACNSEKAKIPIYLSVQ